MGSSEAQTRFTGRIITKFTIGNVKTLACMKKIKGRKKLVKNSKLHACSPAKYKGRIDQLFTCLEQFLVGQFLFPLTLVL